MALLGYGRQDKDLILHRDLGMKVGIIAPVTRTGEYRYAQYLIRGLKERGISIEILNNFILNRPRIRVFIGSVLLNKIIEGKNISILHNLDNLGPYLLRSRGTQTKFILTVQDISPIILPHIGSRIMRLDFKMVLPKLISNTDYVITPSYSTKNDLMSKLRIDENKIGVVPDAVDLSHFYPRPRVEVTKKYGIRGKYILYVGNDNPRKNLKNLILGYCRISHSIPHNLVLAGPINKSRVRKIIGNYARSKNLEDKLLSRVMLPGYINDKDLPSIYSSAAAFVFPSLYEGFGLPPLEAMACGVPVIASYNSSLKETLGQAAIYIYDPLDPEEISRNVLTVLEDEQLQKRLKEEGLKQVRKFSWEKTERETLRVYEEICYGN